MDKKIVIIKLLAIFILVFLAGNFIFPSYFNQGTKFIGEKMGINLPAIGQDFRLGPDLQGGALLTYETIGLEKIEEHKRADVMATLRSVIHRRIEHAGIIDPLIVIQGDRLVIEMAGVFDIDEAKEKIGAAPFLEFKELRPEEELEAMSPYQTTGLTGKYLNRAMVVSGYLEYLVLVEFTGNGVDLLAEITERNLGKPLIIFIDGYQISAPIVRSVIRDGNAQISGDFSREEARQLAQNLNAGALPIRINPEPISQQLVGPALGETYLKQSLMAGVFGFLLVILFITLFYKLAGLVASISLISYGILLLFVFNIFGITLTLAGIAGIILSVGMAVDANILIFSRIKEELKKGNSFEKSIDYGIQRAWPSIRDGNLTTLIIVFILYFSGISFLVNFALGLGVGITISLFTAIIITQNLLKLFIRTKVEKSKLLI